MKKEEATKRDKKKDIAIKVEGLSKTFKIPHEKHTSLKGAALNMFHRKSYEKFEALDDITFEVRRGEFFGIIGRNGSGKSTLLKVLAGIYVPDSGRVEINGKLSPFLELGVGFNPELSGRENLFLGGAILGLARSEITKKFDSIVEFAELKEFIDMKLKNYSSGMQVRLAFSLAINAHAEILLMDEVLAVGDTNFQRKCLNEFIKYKKERRTVVLVTHDTSVVKKYCDRAIELEKGKIINIGSPTSVVEGYLSDRISEPSNNESKKLSGKIGRVKINKIEILNKKHTTADTFKTGEPFIIKASANIDHNLDDLNVSVDIYTSLDDHVISLTFPDDLRLLTESAGRGYFELCVSTDTFLNNTYYAKVSFLDKKTQTTLDVLNTGPIYSKASKAEVGSTYVEHKWA